MTPELYVADCCGGTFVPGHGPDDLHDAEAGAELPLGPRVPADVAGTDGVRYVQAREANDGESHVFKEVSDREADRYDAIRAGRCPSCGEWCPGLTRLREPARVKA